MTLPTSCPLPKTVFGKLLKRYEYWLFRVGDPSCRSGAQRGVLYTPEEHCAMLLHVEDLMRVLLHLLSVPELEWSHHFEAIPPSVKLQLLTTVDSTPPLFDAWLAAGGPSADLTQLPAGAAGAAGASADPEAAVRGDNGVDLPPDVFQSVAAKSDEPESDDDDEPPAPEAVRCCIVQYTSDIQLRIYLLDRVDKNDTAVPKVKHPPRLLFKLGTNKDIEDPLVEPLNFVFIMEVSQSIEDQILAGATFTFANPLVCLHLFWYMLFYKFPNMCVHPLGCCAARLGAHADAGRSRLCAA